MMHITTSSFSMYTIMSMARKVNNHILLSFSCLILLMVPSYSQIDILLQGQRLYDGMKMESASKNFRLKFFSLYSTDRYLGIRYGDESTSHPVWVANRNTPILYEYGSLTIDSRDGNLKILQNGTNPIAVSSVQGASKSNTSATLLDSGNLVLHEMNSDGSIRRVLWQSFDYPTDTLLPGMKLGINFHTGHKWFLQSWLTETSPAQGSYTLGMDTNVTNQLIIRWRGETYWTSGLSLNGQFSLSDSLNFSYTSNEQEAYFTYSVFANVTPMPVLRLDIYGGLTDSRASCISCTDFGVQLDTYPDCKNFVTNPGFMSGDGFKFKQSENMTRNDCYLKCLNNCSCLAFTTMIQNNNTICKIWSRLSRDTKFTDSALDDAMVVAMVTEVVIAEKKWWLRPWLIVAVVGALLEILLCYLTWRKSKGKEKKWWVSLCIVVGVALIIPLLCYICYLMWRKLNAKVENIMNRKKLLLELEDNVSASTTNDKGKKPEKDQSMKHELKIFNYQTIVAATNNFSTTNKLGEGGFGPVYKGKLLDGQEIAIKRLSRSSGQGIVEFKNEAKLIAKLQHTTLVRLLGCSLQGEERIFVYEYMPNGSLDFFIFNSCRKHLLNWKKRFSIIEGIAQGLLYLHKYSRLRVIHRDLKASNILLDDQVNPKISDFGMARIFVVNESEVNTNRIVGTYGYMSPEYAMNGIVSTKVDVFSFGVLVLEIVSGRKNNSFHDMEGPLNLVGYAWQLWSDGKGIELLDQTLDDSCYPNEVQRCIHVGLLCVQDQATDRPTMSDVVSMLTNETMLLPAPKQPAFVISVNSEEPQIPEIKSSENCSNNNVTISVMEAR